MRTHLGCTGSVELGPLRRESQQRLELVEASWLEFSPERSTLEIRHVQPDNVPALREIAGELLEFLSDIPDDERIRIRGGAFYYQDEQTGQSVRLKVWEGGYLTVAWARPDYEHAQWEQFQGPPIPLVFEPYQRLNGQVKFDGSSAAADELRQTLESSSGSYSQGDYEITSAIDGVQLTLKDVNSGLLPLLRKLREVAKVGSLQGEIEVSSFRAGDLEDYCRIVFRSGETWLVRPSLWSDAAETMAPPHKPLQRAA